MKPELVIGTRGSKLALTQTENIRASLARLNDDIVLRIEIIKTTGDAKTDPLSAIGGKGVFTKELEDALLDHRIDIAVHSLKDLPTNIPETLMLGAIGEREDARDALILNSRLSNRAASLDSLPMGSSVGTSSPRRIAQLRYLRRDVAVKDLRGNIDTRLRKLDEGQYDALILATAGLVRLGLEARIDARIPQEQMLPAVGQGAIGLEIRSDDALAASVVSKVDDANTRLACIAERALLRTLGGGCQLPIAAHATITGDKVQLQALVAAPDGTQIIREAANGPRDQGEEIGQRLGERLLERGAQEFLHNNSR
jgi:hydroxymethylbilane synthase